MACVTHYALAIYPTVEKYQKKPPADPDDPHGTSLCHYQAGATAYLAE